VLAAKCTQCVVEQVTALRLEFAALEQKLRERDASIAQAHADARAAGASARRAAVVQEARIAALQRQLEAAATGQVCAAAGPWHVNMCDHPSWRFLPHQAGVCNVWRHIRPACKMHTKSPTEYAGNCGDRIAAVPQQPHVHPEAAEPHAAGEAAKQLVELQAALRSVQHAREEDHRQHVHAATGECL
jgi:hypothetical protein